MSSNLFAVCLPIWTAILYEKICYEPKNVRVRCILYIPFIQMMNAKPATMWIMYAFIEIVFSFHHLKACHFTCIYFMFACYKIVHHCILHSANCTVYGWIEFMAENEHMLNKQRQKCLLNNWTNRSHSLLLNALR